METRVVTVIVHSAKNLKPKKKTSNNFFVVFGVGDKKYSTGVVVDPAGCPCWNDRCDIKLENGQDTILFVVKEKHSTLGKVEVAIDKLLSRSYGKVTTAPLQEHKKCTDPVGSLVYEAWVTKSIGNGELSVEPLEKKGKKSPLSKIKFKSPNLPRAFHNSLKPLKASGEGLMRTRIKSASLTDLASPQPSTFLKMKPVTRSDRSPSCTLARGITGLLNLEDTGPPIIRRIEPSQGTCLGGTVLSIEGENLGNSSDDIAVLEVGRSDCLSSLKYVSSKTIMVTTKPQKPGDVPVTIQTYSGGRVTSNDIFQFVNDTQGINGLQKKSSFLGEIGQRKDGKYVTLLEEELEKLRTENSELKSTNTNMVEYIERLVRVLVDNYPEGLAIPEKNFVMN